ncbi:hypothetical protein ACJMK2_011737 [Sinanodonta woodiana]|uniref:Heat shock 70 kDa protein 12A n=1 Tax=Sinanodonta woodiana TaxID=1069815 RepID=A0ABD3V5Y8_SINWO
MEEPAVVIAIDIGSSHSGYAYQFRGDYKNKTGVIHVSRNWNTYNQTFKTTSCLLLERKTQNRIAIGEKAEMRYSRICDEGKEFDFLFFKNFKMTLYREDFRINDNTKNQAEDYTGKHVPFTLVMSKFICGLLEHCNKKLDIYDEQKGKAKAEGTEQAVDEKKKPDTNQTQRKGGNKQKIDETKIRWVITVPAIWNDVAKGAMRKSAVDAGINSDQLILALEPEAAALYCMYLSPEERSRMDELGNVGSKFMVVDMGGGTIDITAVEVLEKGQLKQIMVAHGGPWGAQRINDAFSQLVIDVFKTKAGTSPFASCTRADLFKMELEFERQKVGLRGNLEPDEEYIKLPLPEKVWKEIKDVVIKNENNKYAHYFDKTDDGLYFKPNIISEKLFGESLQVIMTYLQSVIKKDTACDQIVLVGGFAESDIVKDKFAEVFPSRSINVPGNPFYAVLKGAVLYGQDPDIFKSRISRFTYGTDVCIPFNPAEHPSEKKMVNSTGRILCKDVFSIHVRSNQIVFLNEEQPAQAYNPLEKDQKQMRCDIYQTESVEPKYVTDEGCEKIAVILIEMPDVTGGTSRKVEVTMIYGGTELRVKCIDETTGKEFKTCINYH